MGFPAVSSKGTIRRHDQPGPPSRGNTPRLLSVVDWTWARGVDLWPSVGSFVERPQVCCLRGGRDRASLGTFIERLEVSYGGTYPQNSDSPIQRFCYSAGADTCNFDYEHKENCEKVVHLYVTVLQSLSLIINVSSFLSYIDNLIYRPNTCIEQFTLTLKLCIQTKLKECCVHSVTLSSIVSLI